VREEAFRRKRFQFGCPSGVFRVFIYLPPFLAPDSLKEEALKAVEKGANYYAFQLLDPLRIKRGSPLFLFQLRPSL